MSDRKQRREIDNAVRHLMEFQESSSPWRERMDEAFASSFRMLANRLQVSVEEAESRIMNGDYGPMAYAFLFDDLATALWNGEKECLIDVYLKQRGWREGSYGRRYLRALANSELKLWEVTDVKPGNSINVRPAGTEEKSIRVKEQAGSENIRIWDGLAARILQMDGNRMFSGGILPFPPAQIGVIQRTIARASTDLKDELSAAIEKGEIDLRAAEGLDPLIRGQMHNELADIVFTVWTSSLINAEDQPLPQMFNLDNEPIELTRLRFPVIGDRDKIEAALNDSPVLAEGADNGWAWHPKPVAEIIEGEQVSIHGHIWLTGDALDIETNSLNRAERARAFIQTLAGDLVGEPWTVHENLEQMLHDHEGILPSSEEDLNALPEVQALLQQQMTAHYRGTLDEPIPMLNGKTPRECAADPGSHHEVVEWLKTLENTDQRSEQSSYDFSWMWRELGLDRH